MTVSKDKSVSGLRVSDDLIVLREVKVAEDTIFFRFNRSGFNVWLENLNKHIPEVYELRKRGDNSFSFSFSQLNGILAQTTLKLSLGNDTDWLDYSLREECFKVAESGSVEVFLEKNKGSLVLFIKKKSQFIWSEKIDLASFYSLSNGGFEKADNKRLPVKIGVIGSCFSRSVFRSDDFFNPEYKKSFTVPLTFFHSSLISLMSKSIEDKDYLFINDLLSDQVFGYIEVEFLKNIKERIHSSGVEYLVVDNYSDSALEVIDMDAGCFITYNKYFSESIYKRKFSGKKVLNPGELWHIEKYRDAVKRFYLVLQELGLDKRVVLVGGRLSVFKTQSELWESKMEWIKRTNQNWNVYDAIFLEQFPSAQYIDMRSTSWISDVNPPIVGGASPSHYQSGFYKEIYEKIVGVIFKGK